MGARGAPPPTGKGDTNGAWEPHVLVQRDPNGADYVPRPDLLRGEAADDVAQVVQPQVAFAVAGELLGPAMWTTGELGDHESIDEQVDLADGLNLGCDLDRTDTRILQVESGHGLDDGASPAIGPGHRPARACGSRA